ncbi:MULTISPECIES: GlcG/HbpS family heme-binding protein [Sphingobium]|jgi:uncharacterized protein GlcG (DUF336 family)|uniref:DNA polymerase III subunit delta n=2 Tax=Sphingobium TaxID=165695 RepID=A0A4Q4IUX9_SPHSA|nr:MULTISPECIES: heme-binding protein [Sphingobium]AJR23849.1 hypothetical protein TZ53_09050 [Sphingobium sp. YBL2]MCB4862184.1 heme-binding protein [Sphingobium sp. PNB]QOT73611.1 heme-binding protein [Sphingobium fuliginis]RYL97255.1 heme-binding protein [Sphingobium fuliginis]WDA35669.1 heme-binding protein [Sphingobium sp. YC-XJ3]
MSAIAEIGAPAAQAVERMLSAGRARAEAIGARVHVAVVDGAGNLAGYLRMPGSFLSSGELAIDKAYTAASFAMATRDFGALLERAPRPVRDGLLRRPRLTEVPGGCPAEVQGRLIGAVGVSGGSEVEDEDIAAAALAAMLRDDISGRE